MAWFTLFVAFLVVLTFLFLLPPLLRQPRMAAEAGRRKASNVAIFRTHLAELELEKQGGELSEEAYEQAHRELRRRLLDEVDDDPAGAQPPQLGGPSRKMALVVALLLPLGAVAGYWILGNARALDPVAAMQPEKLTPEQIAGMVGKLAKRLEDNPGDAEGWLMLARSYRSMGQPEKAADAYSKAGAVVFESPDLLTDYADLLAMLNGGSLNGKPMELINKALHLDPDHVVALWLAGTAAFNGKDFSTAVIFWERALKTLQPESEDAKMLSEGVAEAKKRAGFKADPKKSVSGRVVLSPALGASISPNDTVFIFARATDGSRMPIAISRIRVSDLPFDFVLDDSSAMSAENLLSKQARVLVLARVSKTGNAVAKAGDLESEAQTAKLGQAGLNIVIDRVH